LPETIFKAAVVKSIQKNPLARLKISMTQHANIVALPGNSTTIHHNNCKVISLIYWLKADPACFNKSIQPATVHGKYLYLHSCHMVKSLADYII